MAELGVQQLLYNPMLLAMPINSLEEERLEITMYTESSLHIRQFYIHQIIKSSLTPLLQTRLNIWKDPYGVQRNVQGLQACSKKKGNFAPKI